MAGPPHVHRPESGAVVGGCITSFRAQGWISMFDLSPLFGKRTTHTTRV
jgi:hypothetical protein